MTPLIFQMGQKRSEKSGWAKSAAERRNQYRKFESQPDNEIIQRLNGGVVRMAPLTCSGPDASFFDGIGNSD